MTQWANGDDGDYHIGDVNQSFCAGGEPDKGVCVVRNDNFDLSFFLVYL